MAGGIVINGRFVARPGVYSTVDYITIPGAPTQGGTLAVVGDFPFLQQNTPYVSTSERDFKRIAASNPTLLRMANVIYAPLRNAAFAASPAAVYLISPTPTTQAFGMLLDSLGADSIKVASKIWGSQGNQTRFRITPNAAVGGWDVVVANNGVQENIRVPAEPSPATIAYAYPVAVPDPVPATPHTSEGFGVWLSDTGSAVSGEVSASGIDITFTKVLLDECVADVASHVSWEPNGPINGTLSVEVPAGAVLSSGDLTVRVNGVNATTGLADTEDLVFSVAECLAGDTKVTTKSWTSVSAVNVFTATSETFTGTVEISGANFPTLNEANGQTTVAAALQFLAQFAANGFTTSTSSTRTASILISDLDHDAVGPLPLVLSADTWKIVTTVNASSDLVELTDVGTLAPSVPLAGTFFFLAGGSQAAVTAPDWGDALEELRWYDIDDVHAFYDPTGTPPASDAVLPYFFDHINTMWADGANERALWVGAGTDEAFSTLVARAAQFNSERVSVIVDSAYVRQYQGAVELQAPYWHALMHAAASASLLTVNSLTRANLRIEGASRNAALYSSEVVNELIRAGLILTTVPPGGVPRVEREVTTWTVDTNPARTEAICTRSVRDSIKDMREGLEVFLNPTTDGGILRAGDVKAFVEARLEQQKSAYNPIITDYAASSVTVSEVGDRFEVGYVVVVRINKNFITLNVGVTVPVGTA
jgi:hypothetical protein